MLTTLDFGTQVDMLNKTELQEALAEDARLRAIVAGVKSGDLWLNSTTPGMGASVFSSTGTVPQSPAAGFLWAVMNIGVELSGASNVRIYKQIPPTGAPNGGGRFVAFIGSNPTTAATSFSKGQFTLRSGDIFTVVNVTNTINVLSVFLTYIEVPAERQGELWL